MGAAFDLVELTVHLIKPICTDGAAMAVRFRWHDKLTCCVVSELKVRSNLFGRLQFH
jgi:hypothetical protein